MLQRLVHATDPRFRTCAKVRPLIQKACQAHPDIARYETIGTSEEGREIDAVVLGSGAKRVSLIAGSHSDEPVGPETLRLFVTEGLRQRHDLQDLFNQVTFLIVPHINPDGEARNLPWMREWPSFTSYVKHVYRELPGRDLEFGYPDMRKENVHVAEFLKSLGPVAMHVSFHSTAFAEGALLLIERHWVERTESLHAAFREMAIQYGLGLHDHDRGGEKGFKYIGPGFSTTPEGSAMRQYFRGMGDEKTAGLFRDSSMEYVRKISQDPLCLVTEFPLFVITKKPERRERGVPRLYLELKAQVLELRKRVLEGKSIDETIQAFQIEPLPLATAIRLQLQTIEMGLDTVLGN